MKPTIGNNRKLVFISAAFPPIRAGESDHAVQLCRYLSAAGVQVHAITSTGCMDGEDAGFEIHPVMRNWTWKESLRLRRKIKEIDPSAIFLMFSGFLYDNHPMMTYAPTFIKRFVSDIPFITQMEIVFPPIFNDLEKRITRKAAQFAAGSRGVHYSFGTLLRDSDRIITLCPMHYEHFIESFPQIEQKGEIIPPPPLLNMAKASNGDVKAAFRKRLDFDPNEFIICFYGYADHNKGLDTLFEAVKGVRQKNRRIRLLMIGGGIGIAKVNQFQKERKVVEYENGLLSLPSALGIEDVVTWSGGYAWDSSLASELLYASDLCVLPFIDGVTMSRSSLSAAMVHRLPVITTRHTRTEAPLVHLGNIFLVPPRDPAALEDAILRLMDDEPLRNRLRDGATKLAAEWFSWEVAIEKTLKCLAFT